MNRLANKSDLISFRQISISFFDQGLYSINNFLLNIFLARTISSSGYGEFSVAFSIFLFFAGFQNALIIEPMSVLGPAKYDKNLRIYFGKLIVLNLAVTICASILILLCVSVFSNRSFSSYILPMAVILPFLLNFWFTRRFCYVIQRPGIALIGTIVYTFILLGSAFVLNEFQMLDGNSAYYVMGLSGLLGSVISLVIILSKLSFNLDVTKITYRDIILSHWKYGRWVTGSTIVSWFNSIVYVPFIALFLGYAEAGIFRALQNFVLPAQQLLTALGNYLLPGLSTQSRDLGIGVIKKKTAKILFLTLASVISYVVLLLIFRKQLIQLVFPKSDYLNFNFLFFFFGAALIIDSAAHIFSISLRAFQKPKNIFYSQLGGMVTFFLTGIALLHFFKLYGIGWTQIFVSIISLAIILFFYLRIKKYNSKLHPNQTVGKKEPTLD